MTDLNTVIPATSGWQLLQAVSINDRGQIVGSGINAAGQTHGFLLTPRLGAAADTTTCWGRAPQRRPWPPASPPCRLPCKEPRPGNWNGGPVAGPLGTR